VNKQYKLIIEMLKLRITSMVILSTYLGYYLGIRSIGEYGFTYSDFFVLINLLFGTFLSASGANVLNQVIEVENDSKMNRTKNRPLPSGKIKIESALYFGIFLSVVGLMHLYFFTNLYVSFVSLATILLYLFVYTPLKQVSSLNTIVGSVPGALPPVGGWVASTGTFDAPAWILFSILFFWQIPHFLSIAILNSNDYKNGGFKMLPSEFPNSKHTYYHILFFTIALIGASIGLYILKIVGILYATGSGILGVLMLSIGMKIIDNNDIINARKLLYASLLYLPLLLLLIILDKL
tara:strand:- start:1793 stop:2671 length:879 start_codon:yes stop_codon:yes gene_type:complete